MKTVILTALLAVACAYPTGTEGEEIAQGEEALSKEANWGVRSDNRRECTSSHTGTCYYPPSRTVNVCIPSNHGFTGSELARVNTMLTGVEDGLEAGNFYDSPYSFVRTCLSPHVTIRKGSVSPAGGLGITGYQQSLCTNSVVLVETPFALNGTHRYCNQWSALVDIADIDLNWGVNKDHVLVHALGTILLSATGVGLRDTGDVNTWSYTTVQPLGKWGMTIIEACRQAFSSQTANGFDNIAVESPFNLCL